MTQSNTPLAAAPRPAVATPARGWRGASARAISALMLREMATTYGRAPGGYLWAVLEPVGGVAILSIAFSMVLHRPALGSNFALFYASAFLPFLFYTGVSTKIGQAIQFSRPLLAYPAVTYLDAILARLLLNGLTQIMVFALVIPAILALYGLRAEIDFTALGLAFTMLAALSAGIGCLHCYLRSKFPVWDTIWSIANRPLFLVSGIFFLYESLPPGLQTLLWWNPLLHITSEMRRALFPSYHPSFVEPAYVFAVALLCLLAGLFLLRRERSAIVNG